MTNTHRFIVAV